MPREQQGRSRKRKHNREKAFTPLTEQEMRRAEKVARGEKVEEEEQTESVQVSQDEAKYQPTSTPCWSCQT